MTATTQTAQGSSGAARSAQIRRGGLAISLRIGSGVVIGDDLRLVAYGRSGAVCVLQLHGACTAAEPQVVEGRPRIQHADGGWLILLRPGDLVALAPQIGIAVMPPRGGRAVRLVISAPREVPIMREELLQGPDARAVA